MCIFKSAKRQEKKQKLNIECEALFDRINAAIDEANDFFAEESILMFLQRIGGLINMLPYSVKSIGNFNRFVRLIYMANC